MWTSPWAAGHGIWLPQSKRARWLRGHVIPKQKSVSFNLMSKVSPATSALFCSLARPEEELWRQDPRAFLEAPSYHLPATVLVELDEGLRLSTAITDLFPGLRGELYVTPPHLLEVTLILSPFPQARGKQPVLTSYSPQDLELVGFQSTWV